MTSTRFSYLKFLCSVAIIFISISFFSCNNYSGSKISMYYTDSIPKLRVFYKYFDGKKYVAKEIRYYPNSQIQSKGRYNEYNKKTGEWIYYFENGKKQRIENFYNGVKKGKYIEFYKNGKKMIQGYFNAGLPDGQWFIWNEKGIKISATKYENGKIFNQKK